MTKHFIVIITSFGASLNIVKSQISLFVAAIKQLNCLPNRMLLQKKKKKHSSKHSNRQIMFLQSVYRIR